MRYLPLAALLLIGAAPAQQPFDLADFVRIAEIGEPAFTPDGEALIYTLSSANLAIDATVSDLWEAPWNGGAPKRLTRTDEVSEWQPAPSPDGKRIFFLSDAAKDETVQVWSMPRSGGKARQETQVAEGINDFALSPDGKRLVLVAELANPPKPKGKSKLRSKPPIVIDRFSFSEDGRGLIGSGVTQLLLVDLAGGEPVQLTNGQSDVFFPSWAPDGSTIAYVGYRDEAAVRVGNSDVFTIAPVAGAAPRQVSTSGNADIDPSGEPMRPAWSPDSKQLAWVTMAEPKWIYYSPPQLSLADLSSGQVREVARLDKWTYSPRWSADGRQIYALIEQDRASWLASIDASSGKVRYLTSGATMASAYALGAQDRVAVLEGQTSRPNLLRQVSPSNATIADHNAWLVERNLARPQAIEFPSADGTPIHGFLTLPPPGTQPSGTKPPLMIRVHGGPVSQFGHEFSREWQVYAAQGYAVLAVNPRGSSGRGFDFSRAIYADWGNKDAADVKAGIDWVLAKGLADPGKIGIGGWSYGGILTNYMIASDPRIKAAVSGAGVSNVYGLWGVDQYAREYEQELGTPWDNREVYDRVSYPFFKAGKISAPTLFLCAGSDLNVPCAGAQQMYQALRTRGMPTRLVVYPGANHGLTAPSHLRDRIQRSLDWYAQHLKEKQP